jgi:leucine dehydrogenase
MEVVRRSTQHVSGLPLDAGGSGDPSPATAYGVFAAMKSAAEHLEGNRDLHGMRVAVQGVGKVGGALVGLLRAEGCDVVVSDVRPSASEAIADRYGATVVSADEILSQTCDFLAPCALGGAISAETAPTLRCRAVVGSANNQLTRDDVADILVEAGVLYVPDFVANAGGLINIADELNPGGYEPSRALTAVSEIGRSVTMILRSAAENRTNPLVAALALAESRLH